MRPKTSEAVVPIFEQRIVNTHGKIQRRLFEGRGRIAFAKPDQSSIAKPIKCVGIISSSGGDKSCDWHSAIDDLDLTATTNFIDVARQIRLQLGDRCGCHRVHSDSSN